MTSRSGNKSCLFSGVKAGYKIWLEKDGVAFGDGLFELLLLIDKCGSISQAASSMNMSYRAAWGKIKAFEKQWQVPLVLSRAGGPSGGGTVLTSEAAKIVECFRCFQSDLELAMEKARNKCFNK